MTRFIFLTFNGLAYGAIYAAVALALVLIWRTTRVLNFAQGAMAMASAYVAVAVHDATGSYWLAFAAALASGPVFGVLAQQTAFRGADRMSPLNTIVIGVGLLILIEASLGMIYGIANRDLRHAYLHPSRRELEDMPPIYASCAYPDNITPANLLYFWWAPTLVYQPAYPRTDRVRWRFFGKRVAEALSLSVLMWFMSAQYAAPLLHNSLHIIDTLDWVRLLERVLKLSTISLVIWLAGFYALFHSALNALAEVMRFGDRNFYADWWNSRSFGGYWSSWNKPVYHFFKRHIHQPLLGRGFSRGFSALVVFFVSGVLHEALVGVPTHCIYGKAPRASPGFVSLEPWVTDCLLDLWR